MDNTAAIYEFATKWYDRFKNPLLTDHDLLSLRFGKECSALGFADDKGVSFANLYGAAVCNAGILRQRVHRVREIPELGAAIYARWRYYHRRLKNYESVLDENGRQWFLTALFHLSVLTEEQCPFWEIEEEKLSDLVKLKEEIVDTEEIPEQDCSAVV